MVTIRPDGRPAGTAGPRSRLRRAAAGALALVGLALAVVAVDAAVLVHRMPEIPVTLPGSGDGTAYLLLASDSRERLPGPDRDRYADALQARGERADLVLVLRAREGEAPRLVSIPRDLYVRPEGGTPYRLGLALTGGPQAMATALCDDLGIGVDHVVVLDFRGLIDLVDATGGVSVRTPAPVRDRRARLSLPSAGAHRLDGEQALAWVRSRQPEVLAGGRWVPAEADLTRTSHAVDVLGQTAQALDDPVTAQRALWAVGPRLRRDKGLGVLAAASLARDLRGALRAGRVATAPARLSATAVPIAFPVPATDAALEPFRTSTCPGRG